MKIMNNIESIRDANGGTYYQCAVCGYSNKSFWVVYGHAILHTCKAVYNGYKLVRNFIP